MDTLYASERSFEAFKNKIIDTPNFDLNIPKVADNFLLTSSDSLGYGEFYTPFDFVNTNAKIVIVGMSPNSQWAEGMEEARKCLLKGMSDEDTLYKAKEVGAFSGDGLRKRLVQQLDVLQVNKAFGMQSCSELFNKHRDKVHLTSCFVNCIQSRDSGYRWVNPANDTVSKNTKHPFFVNCLKEGFLREIRVLREATIYLPLGKPACIVFESLIRQRYIKKEKVILGLQHPSTNNGHLRDFLLAENSPKLSDVKKWESLRQQMRYFLE